MKAVTFARVSSKYQEENYSLEGQNTHLFNYAKANKLDVIKSYEISESATRGDRAKFREMIDFCCSQKECIAIIVDDVDRLLRTFNDAPDIEKLVQKGQIEIHFYNTSLILTKNSTSDDYVKFHELVLDSEKYIAKLKKNTARGRNEKVMEKHMASWQAPCGYEKFVQDDSKKSMRPKEPDATYLKKLFELYSLGGTSIHKLVDLADEYGVKTKNGNKIGVTSMIEILKNPFYYGEMRFNGELYQHNHGAIISRELWEACQKQYKLQSSKSFKQGKIPYLYRNIFTDWYKNRTCSCEKKKNKYIYIGYYRDSKYRSYVNEKDIDDQVVSILNQISIPQNFIDDYNLYVQSAQQEKIAFKVAENGHINAEITKIDNRLKNLFDRLLDNKMTEEEYEKKKQEYEEQKSKLEKKIQNQDTIEPDSKQISADSVPLFSRLGDIFKMGISLENKQMLLRLIFKERKIRDGNVGYILNEPFSYFMKQESQASA